ncbi:MAG: thiamine phosphate synthase [Xanthomonadaceae bacterium]|nr:thiamine phosphate synthase [Xanthomonadaceae bacterium]
MSLLASTPGLYLITPDEADTSRLIARVDPLLTQPGVTWLQYRNKTASADLHREQASALRGRCANARIPFIVNDDIQLALDVCADGVHLGEYDDDISAARTTLGEHALIGASCYDDIARAKRAVDAGASYVAFGAFFPTRNKNNTRHATLDLLTAAKTLEVPTVAIGGITPENMPPILAAGADLIAVIGGVFDTSDPAAAIRAYSTCLQDFLR